MIFKDNGVYCIHCLRVIHIYEADFNLLLAVKWRQLLHSTDQAGIINECQFGGRPGCEAQSLTLLEELKNNILYLTRRTLFNFDNDASSCYDPYRCLLGLPDGSRAALFWFLLPPWKKHGVTFAPPSVCQKPNMRTTSSFPCMAADKAAEIIHASVPYPGGNDRKI